MLTEVEIEAIKGWEAKYKYSGKVFIVRCQLQG